MAKEKTSFYLENLKSDKCQSGATKKPMKSFCFNFCWFRLPSNIKNDLYSGVRQGYEEAYDAAMIWLVK